MGIVFSCLGSTTLLVGEMFSTLVLSIGEVSSLLVRGLFGLMTGMCDVLAACMCCCRVPFSERPSRDGYTYATIRTPAAMSKYNATAETTVEGDQVKDKRYTRVVDAEKFSKASFKAPIQYFVKPQVTFIPASIKKPEGEAAAEDGEKKDEAAPANFFGGFSAAFKRMGNGKAPETEEATTDEEKAEEEKKAAAPKRNFFKGVSLNSLKKKTADKPADAEDKPAEGEAATADDAANNATAKKGKGMFGGMFGGGRAATAEEAKPEEAKKDE